MTDEGAGQVGTYAYDAWGNVTASSGAEENEYKFTSRRWDSAGGLQYNRARFYDPAIGRFISPDPLTGGPDDPTISYFGGLYSAFHRFLKEYVDALQPHNINRYAYCYSNPINYIDPLGLIDPPKVEGGYQPGYVLLRGRGQFESGVFSIENATNSDYRHTGIVGPDGNTVYQSGEPVCSVNDFYKEYTHVAVVIPNVSESQMAQAAQWAEENVKSVGYNFELTSNANTSDTVNCAEFAERAYTDGANSDPGLPAATSMDEGLLVVGILKSAGVLKDSEVNTNVPVRKPGDWMKADSATITAEKQKPPAGLVLFEGVTTTKEKVGP